MKTYWGSGGRAPHHFTPSEITPGICWIEGWMGPRASLDMVSRIIPSPCQKSDPNHPAHSQYQNSYTDSKHYVYMHAL